MIGSPGGGTGGRALRARGGWMSGWIEVMGVG